MERLLGEHESGLWSDMVMPKIDPRTSETKRNAQDRFSPSSIPGNTLNWDFKHSEPRQRVF